MPESPMIEIASVALLMGVFAMGAALTMILFGIIRRSPSKPLAAYELANRSLGVPDCAIKAERLGPYWVTFVLLVDGAERRFLVNAPPEQGTKNVLELR